MTETDRDIYLGAYWWDRNESAGECADRLARFLTELSSCHEFLREWYETGKSRKESLSKRIDVTSQSGLAALLAQGRHGADELGYHLGLWNGANDNHSIGLSISCGGYSTQVGNAVVVDLLPDLGSIAGYRVALCMLAAAARAWEPRWAQIASRRAREQRGFDPGKPFLDWMLYLSRAELPIDLSISAPSELILIDQLGAIVVTQHQAPDPTNETHISQVDAVKAALGL